MQKVPQWFGETVGFWNGNTLVAWTKNVQGWTLSHSMFEFSNQMQVIETFTPSADGRTLTVEATFYSALEFDAFERWLDPESWPVLCPWFFLDMDLVRPRASLAAPGAWNAVYDGATHLVWATVCSCSRTRWL